MTECNNCGRCCDPVNLSRQVMNTILGWANMPDPVNSPHVYPVWAYDDVQRIQDNIENGNFASRFWLDYTSALGNPAMLQIKCPWYNRESHMCEAHDMRPPICRGYPWYGEDPEMKIIDGGGLNKECSFWEDVSVELRPRGWGKKS